MWSGSRGLGLVTGCTDERLELGGADPVSRVRAAAEADPAELPGRDPTANRLRADVEPPSGLGRRDVVVGENRQERLPSINSIGSHSYNGVPIGPRARRFGRRQPAPRHLVTVRHLDHDQRERPAVPRAGAPGRSEGSSSRPHSRPGIGATSRTGRRGAQARAHAADIRVKVGAKVEIGEWIVPQYPDSMVFATSRQGSKDRRAAARADHECFLARSRPLPSCMSPSCARLDDILARRDARLRAEAGSGRSTRLKYRGAGLWPRRRSVFQGLAHRTRTPTMFRSGAGPKAGFVAAAEQSQRTPRFPSFQALGGLSSAEGIDSSRGSCRCGGEVDDGGERYRVVRVEQPCSEAGFGRAWAESDMAESGLAPAREVRQSEP